MKDKIMYYNLFSTPINPKVIFYGECLPLSFLLQFIFISGSDLAFIMGISLKVSPSNQLPDKLSSGAWRIFVNKEDVEGISKFNDAYREDLSFAGYTDQIIGLIVKEVGWENDFNNYCENLKNLKKSKNNI